MALSLFLGERRAIEFFQEAIELEPNSKAIVQCERTIDLHPSFSHVHLYLGLAYEQIGQCKEALAEFERASELSSRAPETVAAPGHT